MMFKKKLQVGIKKKKREEEQSVAYGIGLERKLFGSCNMMYITCSDTDA